MNELATLAVGRDRRTDAGSRLPRSRPPDATPILSRRASSAARCRAGRRAHRVLPASRRATAHRRTGSAPNAAPGCASIHQALRDALDRDIAAIDAMLSRAARCHPASPPPAQAGRHLARHRLAGRQRRPLQPAEDQAPQRRLAGDLPRPGTRDRIRPEPAVPQGLRRRIRHARRRTLWPAGRRPRRAAPRQRRIPHR